jgi:hypothetical protein
MDGEIGVGLLSDEYCAPCNVMVTIAYFRELA